MAVGYHKLNTSAARSKSVEKESVRFDISKLYDFPPGSVFFNSKYGELITTEGFNLGDKISVKCECSSGEVVILSTFLK